MITQQEIQRVSENWALGDHIIEKDYILGWLLWGIAKHPVLSKAWVLKGGLALKKCYVDTHRHSQDMDFTVLPTGPWRPDDVLPIINEVLAEVARVSGIAFSVREPSFEMRPHGRSCVGKIYFTGPRRDPSPAGAKLDITHAEDLMRPPVLRHIAHPYSDRFPDEAQIYCYSFEELFAEKIRALAERARPGDLYDTVYLFRRSDLNAEPALIGEVLEHKCDFKGIPVPQLLDVRNSQYWKEMEQRWKPMLSHAVGFLPALNDYWDELPALFAWLHGEEYKITLLPIDAKDVWCPAPVVWRRGQTDLLEPIRYAAVNRLLVNLGYGGRYRLVEPYSLRLTKAGNVLFYALKAESREIRSYRLDRIQGIEVTHAPFTPAFRIEFTPEGRVPVPYVNRRRRFISSRSTHRYVIQCAVCEKLFYRDKYNTRINPHKHKDLNVQCSGRYGYLV